MTTLSEVPIQPHGFLTQADRIEWLSECSEVPMVSDADIGEVRPRVRIEVRDEGGTVTVAPLGLFQRPNSNMREIINESVSLLSLERGWDTYNADRIRPDAVERSLEFLMTVRVENRARPSVVPTVEGGIQLEWHQRGVHVEVEFPPFEDARVFVRQDDTEWEGGGDEALLRAIDLIPTS